MVYAGLNFVLGSRRLIKFRRVAGLMRVTSINGVQRGKERPPRKSGASRTRNGPYYDGTIRVWYTGLVALVGVQQMPGRTI